MAVFTPVTFEQVSGFLQQFELGALGQLQGIASGIENTNYFLDTDRGRYVLTLFEQLSNAQLPFYLNLMKHLALRGIACPDPVARRDGSLLGELAGKPAAIVTRLQGRANMHPQAPHCAQVGDLLARMHLAAADFAPTQPNLRGLQWWVQTAPRVKPFLTSDQVALLDDELQTQQQAASSPDWQTLPRSAVHADLFRDNVLFDGNRLGGAIDFYFAGVDTWMFDLAVTCNDWCIDDTSGEFDEARLAALLSAYRAVRPPGQTEVESWPLMLRGAALRFWLSRLFDLHLPRPAQMVTPKDPTHFERLLRSRRAKQQALD
jgi:homoserine kinase type II